MQPREAGRTQRIMDREMLMQQTTCAACGNAFALGEPVVLACGAWTGPPRWMHENEAVYDQKSGEYVERSCFNNRH